MASRANRLQEAINTVEELQEEIFSWKQNMEGTNLENTSKYEQLQECEDQLQEVLDAMEYVEFPGAFGR